MVHGYTSKQNQGLAATVQQEAISADWRKHTTELFFIFRLQPGFPRYAWCLGEENEVLL